MTRRELREWLACGPEHDDWPVTVAGHGALHAVTKAGAEDGTRVVVLYVAEPEPAPPVDLVLSPPECAE